MGLGTDRLAEAGTFRHEALFYEGDEAFVAATLPFIRRGLARDESVLVAVGLPKIDALRDVLDRDADRIEFEDMATLGRNPARIIPAWRDFVDQNAAAGRGCRGVGEPIGPERSAEELVECQRHESLLNLAFADPPPWRLGCPYDVTTLDREVLEDAARSHPWVMRDGRSSPSDTWGGLEPILPPLTASLPEPPGLWDELSFGEHDTSEVRRFVRSQASRAGLDDQQSDAVVLAAHELATNSVRHGGGGGLLRVWRDGCSLVCEVRDAGHITEPLWGRQRPGPDQAGGRGAWLVNQLCDLVQVRSDPEGNVIRIHVNGARGA